MSYDGIGYDPSRVLALLLFGQPVANPAATLQTIADVRTALEYLENRYARQVADGKAAIAAAADPKPARKANGNGSQMNGAPRKRGRRPAAPPPQPEMFTPPPPPVDELTGA